MKRAVRYSEKREAILRLLQSTQSHPTADWIYQSLKPTHPDLSLGTVYRNLAFFQEQGTVRSVAVVGGQGRRGTGSAGDPGGPGAGPAGEREPLSAGKSSRSCVPRHVQLLHGRMI